MRNDHEEVVPPTDGATPIDLSTLELGEVTELTKDGNPFSSRFDFWFWGLFYGTS
jgi:hypothetical protein